MIIGLPKETKEDEYRVGLTPGNVHTLAERGHKVLVEAGAGAGSIISDQDYQDAGATIVAHAADAWSADLVVKVKEPTPAEYQYLRKDLMLFAYLHLASNRELAEKLLANEVSALAYETVQIESGMLPLLMPMSEVAGRMAVQIGATYLLKTQGGRGVLMGGVPGVAPANVVILGAGAVGTNAAVVATGMGAMVTVLDINYERLKALDDRFSGRLQTRYCDAFNVRQAVYDADLVIGAVLIPGGRTPWLVTRKMLPNMRTGSVIVDVAVDQGGCVETTRPTTHSHPVFEVDGVLHYGVTNMPGAVPRTSTFALNNQTANYVACLADEGLAALQNNQALMRGLNVYRGQVMHSAVAKAFDLPYISPRKALVA